MGRAQRAGSGDPFIRQHRRDARRAFVRRLGFRGSSPKAARLRTWCRTGRSADFYIRYPDEVYLAQVREFTDNAARAAALATGTKVKIDNYGRIRDGISSSTLAELGFAYMKHYGATKIEEAPGKPQGFDETGSVSSAIPGIGFSAYTSERHLSHLWDGSGRSDRSRSSRDSWWTRRR